jgi:large subunit ribosomal protein L25
MASRAYYIALAKQLPPTLLRFFARYPPAAILSPSSSTAVTTAGAPSPSQQTPYQTDRGGVSPFRFWKHHVTGKWHDPVFSLRRQADLLKLAREHGVEELMPASDKGIEFRTAKRVAEGLQVKGTGVGQRVKGHMHERMMIKKWVFFCGPCASVVQGCMLMVISSRMSARRKAMLGMPQLVARWRIVSITPSALEKPVSSSMLICLSTDRSETLAPIPEEGLAHVMMTCWRVASNHLYGHLNGLYIGIPSRDRMNLVQKCLYLFA